MYVYFGESTSKVIQSAAEFVIHCAKLRQLFYDAVNNSYRYTFFAVLVSGVALKCVPLYRLSLQAS